MTLSCRDDIVIGVQYAPVKQSRFWRSWPWAYFRVLRRQTKGDPGLGSAACAAEHLGHANQPIWKLSELLAKHKGQRELEPDGGGRHLASRRIHLDGAGRQDAAPIPSDTRAWWIVQDGQIRFTIEGQEPFVASRDTWCRFRIATFSAWKRSETSRR